MADGVFGPPLSAPEFSALGSRTGPVPEYATRTLWLVEEAARLLRELRERSVDWATLDAEGKQVGLSSHEEVERWLSNYEIHINQVDHPGLEPLRELPG